MEPYLEELLEDIRTDVRSASRFVGPNADAEAVREAAASGTLKGRVAEYRGTTPRGGVLRSIKAARRGDASEFARLTRDDKAWSEGVDSAGGFLVRPEQLDGYVETMRAAAPLRERCSRFEVNSNEVWIVLEGNPVVVEHVAEGATKPDATGTLSQKVSTVHKAAGTTVLSDELIEDTNGTAERLVARSFAKQAGILIDRTILTGDGVGEPTGLWNTAGVTKTAVDGQTGQALYNSVLKAVGRLREKFFDADTIAIHPRDLTKFDLSLDAQDRYLFEDGLRGKFGSGVVVPDANIPTNLGGSSNESFIVVSAMRESCYFFSRHPLRIDASSDVLFTSDQTIIRAVERYGFACVIPAAVEILTGVTP